MPRRLRLLRLCAAVLSAAGKIRYARQQSIGQAWKLGQKDNHGGWDWPGQLDQAGFVSAFPNGDICVCAGQQVADVHVLVDLGQTRL